MLATRFVPNWPFSSLFGFSLRNLVLTSVPCHEAFAAFTHCGMFSITLCSAANIFSIFCLLGKAARAADAEEAGVVVFYDRAPLYRRISFWEANFYSSPGPDGKNRWEVGLPFLFLLAIV